jgi:hypothetical protein
MLAGIMSVFLTQTTFAQSADVIDAIVESWRPVMEVPDKAGGWESELRAALAAATEAQIDAVLAADSYAAVGRILVGASTSTVSELAASGELSVTAPLDVGDPPLSDLIYTPVPPCRVADTRGAPGGIIVAGTARPFRVYGNPTEMSAQGGNPAGCAPPRPLPEEPSAAVINVTSTGQSGQGHLRLFPFGEPTPTVSILNYLAGRNVANEAVTTTCVLCGNDIEVFSGVSSSHVVLDVSGYPERCINPGMNTLRRRSSATSRCSR